MAYPPVKLINVIFQGYCQLMFLFIICITFIVATMLFLHLGFIKCIHAILFKLIKICWVIWWNKYLTVFFHCDSLLPTLSFSSLHCEALFAPSQFSRDEPTRLWPPRFSESPAQTLGSYSSYIRPQQAERRYDSCTDISRVTQCLRTAVCCAEGRGRGTGPGSSWQPPKGKF